METKLKNTTHVLECFNERIESLEKNIEICIEIQDNLKSQFLGKYLFKSEIKIYERHIEILKHDIDMIKSYIEQCFY